MSGRLESIIEWAVAAAFIVALLAAGSLVVGEFRAVSAVEPVIAGETFPPAVVPAAVPPRAVSVPMLLLADGTQVRVGDSVSAVAERLGPNADAGVQSIERDANGGRLTRFYDMAGARFILVFEPADQSAEQRVTAIYRQ